jgi:two-component system nitrogen regulation response regulator GlnG
VKNGTEPVVLDDAARKAWRDYAFPGNVRELKNIIIRLTTKSGGYTIGTTELEAEFSPQAEEGAAGGAWNLAAHARRALASGEPFVLDSALREVEQAYLEAALEMAGGNMSQAAKLLGVSRSTLYSRIEAANKAGARLRATETP